jgi:formylglycine-generating enzyme required for sulfatase activity
MTNTDPDRQELIRLHKLLIESFDLEELRVLCFYLGPDYEDLAGKTKNTKMHHLITYLQRRGELPRLLDEVNSQRPNVAWPEFAPTKEDNTVDTDPGAKPGMEMIHIPDGEFIYGKDRLDYLPEFWISKTPVTNAQYLRFIRATGHESPEHWKGKTPKAELANHPVTYVSWHDAKAYADWVGMHLPTEEEWEKAARGTDGRIYPWGNEWHEGYCNTDEADIGGTTPVGHYSPQGDSPYGCVDMAGNVWEWTDAKDEAGRVVRGGSWLYDQNFARAASRNSTHPASRYGNGSFRLVVRRPPSR